MYFCRTLYRATQVSGIIRPRDCGEILVEYLRHSYGCPVAKNLKVAVNLSCGDIAALICVSFFLIKGDTSDSNLLYTDSFMRRKFL